MELAYSESHFYLIKGEHSLLIDRRNCSFTSKPAIEIRREQGFTCLGKVYGFVGKLQFSKLSEPKLIFINKKIDVGVLNGCKIYKISSVVAIPLDGEYEVSLDPCTNPDHRKENPILIPIPNIIAENAPLNKIKIKASSNKGSSLSSRSSEKNADAKVEKRMLEEFYKLFNESDSFYYSFYYDITNSVQRQFKNSENNNQTNLPFWKRADYRFFWNYFILNDLINSKDESLDRWILPIIQGYVQIEYCVLESNSNDLSTQEQENVRSIDLGLISRRSRFRAGTRYLRRGVDEGGHVANYVETEQILIFNVHKISFVQIRGSIPIFWSQPGFKYRPPPRLEKSEEENFYAFSKHFDTERELYGSIIALNLVERAGKEKVLGDAYLNHLLNYNKENLTYLSCDFHECCRGMRFDNLSIIIDALSESLKEINYCWIDSYGQVLKQNGVCRINCVDCLDRTNVVMTQIAKHILSTQLSKIGMAPEPGMPPKIRQVFQTIWANNGDALSKQYAGTNALKGDFTRTGERKLTGVMKDGVNSANRYYLNRFKDTSRQAIIDLLIGVKQSITEADLESDAPEKATEEKENTAEQIKSVIEDVKKLVIPPNSNVHGCWGLVNAKSIDSESLQLDIDIILILTDSHYYITEYDCTLDAITETQIIQLKQISGMEIGYEIISSQSNIFSLFHSTTANQQNKIPSLRILFEVEGEGQHFHQFRSSSFRFFNNVPVPIHQTEEMLESLRVIAESIKIAVSIQNKAIEIINLPVLPTRDTATNRPSMPVISSFVNRYFHFGSQLEADNRKGRRDSQVSSASIKEISDLENKSCMKLSAENEAKLSKDQLNKMEDKNSIFNEKDLVLSSCGLISLSQSNNTCTLLESSQTSNFIGNDIFSNAESITFQEERNSSDNNTKEQSCQEDNIHQQHRLSLPEDAIRDSLNNINLNPLPTNNRSQTPEIKISETQEGEKENININKANENNNNNNNNSRSFKTSFFGGKKVSGLSIPFGNLISKRMSRSSEDINKINNSNIANRPNQMNNANSRDKEKNYLETPIKTDNRSSSDIDIFGTVNMKLSHSENTLGDTSLSSQSQNALKKDIVIAPYLGKFARGVQNLGANYLDPRKLRDSFKQQPKSKSTEYYNDKNPNEDIFLQERIKNSKSSIIIL